jgi:proteasome accessory factor A
MMSVRSLMGVETEYAVTALCHDGSPYDRGTLVERLFAEARKVLPHVRDCGTGLFLSNGARFYLDRGHHPEFATPECGDPWEVVRYIRAGEAILLDLAERVKHQSSGIAEVSVFRCNVEYDRSGTTWGCHESYLHSVNSRILPGQLIPHFVTRIVYAGAGGFNPLLPGAEFTLSPRAWLLPNVTANDSTGERGIFHCRDEALAGPSWERMHVICGESLCSDTAAVLKMGTTALILAALAAGRLPGNAVKLASPVHALRKVAISGRRAAVDLEGGGTLSPVEIQWHYLAMVEQCRASQLPEWAPELCALWRRQLIALEAEDPALDRTFDWAIKRALYRRWVTPHLSWERFHQIGDLVETMERVAQRRFRREDEPPLCITAMLANGAVEAEQRHRLTPILDSEGTTWADLRLFFEIRNQLFEADVRFGELGERGIFTQLDQAGLLTHRLDRRVEPRDVLREPPPGRASVRGRNIHQLWTEQRANQYRGDWTVLWSEQTGSTLDLSYPFVTAAQWR